MRFDIAQIQNPVALHKAKENLRNQLAAANVPSDVIDQLLTQCVWDIAIKPPSPSISGYEKDDYDEKRRAARKAFGAVDAQVGQICKRIMDHCMSERMLSAIKMHKEFHNEVRSESLQGNVAKLVSVIFELVKKTEGNPASVIACSLFNDKMLDDNLSTFVYDKQITYDAYRSLKPTTAKQKINEFETIVVSAILDCHILTQDVYSGPTDQIWSLRPNLVSKWKGPTQVQKFRIDKN